MAGCKAPNCPCTCVITNAAATTHALGYVGRTAASSGRVPSQQSTQVGPLQTHTWQAQQHNITRNTDQHTRHRPAHATHRYVNSQITRRSTAPTNAELRVSITQQATIWLDDGVLKEFFGALGATPVTCLPGTTLKVLCPPGTAPTQHQG